MNVIAAGTRADPKARDANANSYSRFAQVESERAGAQTFPDVEAHFLSVPPYEKCFTKSSMATKLIRCVRNLVGLLLPQGSSRPSKPRSKAARAPTLHACTRLAIGMRSGPEAVTA